MGKERVEKKEKKKMKMKMMMQIKRRQRDLAKKVRGPCNFCEFSGSRYECSSEEKLHEQDKEAALRKEVERLRLSIKKMTGKDDCVSFTELLALESHLEDVCRTVDQKEKIKLEEDEKLRKQKEAEDDGTRRGVLVPSSSEGKQEKLNKEEALLRMKINFERRNAESLQCEFERLWLFNERMNGRELEGMTSFDLRYLHIQILHAMTALTDLMSEPRREQISSQQEKRCSLDNDKNYDTCLEFRLVHVSRKLRKICNPYYHRKSMPETRSSGRVE